ncbi:MAG: LamG-like jellyroll fold domain-containing protein [Sedimentisphaeraceae bacterium JB056]
MMRKLLLLSVMMVALSSAYGQYYAWQNEYDGTNANTVVLWNFDEFESTERALNVVNNYRPYVIKQGAATFAEDGKFGGCFRNIGGTSSANYGQIWGDVSAPVPFPQGVDPSLSVEMWISMNDYTYTSGYLIDKCGATKSGYLVYLYRTDPGQQDVYRLYFKTGDTNTEVVAYADLQWDAGKYYHIACTWDADTDTAKVYRDGVEVASSTYAGVAITDSVSAAKLANRVLSTYGSFNGAIDGVRISSVAYDYAVPPDPYAWMSEYDGTEDGTICLWNFDEFDTNGQALNVVTNYRPYVIQRGASYFAEDGKFGGCFRNVGGTIADDYGQIYGGTVLPYPFPTGSDPSLGIEMWISMDEYQPGVSYLIDKYASAKSGYRIYMNQVYADRETVYRVYFETGDGTNVVQVWADMVWRPNKYYHLACTWDAATDTAKIYRNGREYVSKTFPGISITDNAYGPRLGNRLLASYGAFKGAFDGVRISSIAQDYKAPEPASPYYGWTEEYDGSDAYAIALWNFNENEIYTVGADTCALNSFSNITVNGWSTDYRAILRGYATFEPTGGAFDPNAPGIDDGSFVNYGGSYSTDFAFAWGGAEIFPDGSDPSLTIEAWVRFDDMTNDRSYVFDKCYSTASGYQLYFYKEPWMADNQYYSWLETGDGTTSARVTELCSFEEGKYYHVAGVWDADTDTLSLYINGELIGSSYWPGLAITNNTQVLRIGNRLGATYGCMDGAIDGARISEVAYDFAVIPEEVPVVQPGDVTGDGYVGEADVVATAGQWLNETASGVSYGNFFTPAADTKSALDQDDFYPEGQNMLFSLFGVNQYDLSKVKDSDMNAIGPYFTEASGGLIRGDTYLSYIDDFGLGVKYVYRLGMDLDWDDAGFVMPSDSEITSAFTTLVNEVVEDQNIAVWYIAPEELRPWEANELHYLDVATAAIRAADTYDRPIWMYEPNHRPAEDLDDTFPYQDYCGKGSYVNTSGYEKERIWVKWSMEQVNTAIANSGTTGTAINVLEMATDPASSSDYSLIDDYVHHDVYLSLTNGAKGLFVWSGARRTGFDSFPIYQEAYEQIASELNGEDALADVFLYGEEKTDITASITSGPMTASASNGYSSSSITCKSYNGIDGVRYLFVINSANAQVDVQLNGLPATDAYIKDIFADGSYSETAGTMAVSLSPWQVKAYRIVPETGLCGLEGSLYMQADISGANGNPDCIVNFYDFVRMAENWLECATGNCI